jgi:tRNA G46 methylase TrmB
MATSSAVNTRAATGFKNAANYDTHRPTYPPEAVQKLLAHLGVANQDKAQIIELACGTGKFTELLAARPENFEVLAVEPHVEMRQELVKKNLGKRIKVLDGHAGAMPIEEGWGDCLIAAQVRILQNFKAFY